VPELDMEKRNEPSPALRYLMALLAPAMITGLIQLTWPFLKPSPTSLYLLAVMTASWYGGLGPGLLSVLISCLLGDYLFIEPIFSLRVARGEDLERVTVLAIVGLFISVLSELMHSEKRRAQMSLDNTSDAKEALRVAQARTESVLASLADTHILFDQEWRYVYVNEAAVRAIGRPREEILGHTLWELYPDIVGTELDRQYRRAMEQRVALSFDFYYSSDDTWWENHFYPAPEGLAVFATNITERKRAEEALRQAEQKYRDIFENAGEGIFQSTPDGRYIAANPALARMYGFASPEEFIRSRTDISRETYADPQRREEFKRLLEAHGMVRGFELQGLHKDGSRIWITVNARAVRDQHGKVLYYEGTGQDITERKRAEEALRESEERYRELFENAKDATYVHDLSGRYTSVNRAAEKLSGRSRNEIIGRSFIDFVPPEQIQIVSEHLHQKLVKEGETSYETEVISSDGRRIPVEVNSHLIYENGAGISVQGTARDITERKRAEQALRQSEERFSKAFHSSPAALSISLLEDGRLLEVNAAFLRMTGLDREEVIGHSSVELGLWAKEFRQGMVETLRERGAVANLEIKFQKKSGEIREGLLSAELIQLGAGPSVLVIGQDVTERNRAEKALQGFPRQLIEAQEAERQSIARELHDQIGQVLTAIHLNLEAVRKSCGNSEARVLIDEGVGIVDELLEQVRDLSFELRPSLLDDLGLVAALRWYTDRFARRTGIHAVITIKLPEDPPRLTRELETACFRIVQEALTNVVRHARAENVWIKLKSLNDEVWLSIKDDGIGFDAPSQDLLHFTTHVGLRGMRERALAVGGGLEVRSSLSGGTQVRAHFPVQSKKDEWHE
jgi:PAS domain S-box-containing protein